MFKKIAIALLVLTVLGAGGAAMIYNVTTVEPASAEEAVVVQNNNQGQQGKESQGQREVAAEGSQGEPWSETGTIVTLEDVGFEMTLQNGETAFVELGPADYWQAQQVALTEGDTVMIEGNINEGMIHATTLTTSDDQVLVLRNENGQPMWSGGASGGQSGNGEGQIQVDEWITLEGALMAFQGGNMTMSTVEGEIVNFQTGQPRFFAEQGISFQVGDEIVVVGFYQGETFQAGDITQVATGERVMLRDPNGRPLWAGPGNGQGNGNH